MFLQKPNKPSPTNDFFMTEGFCSDCIDFSLFKSIWEKRKFTIEQIELSITMEALQCVCCGAIRFSKEINERNFERVYRSLQDERTRRQIKSLIGEEQTK